MATLYALWKCGECELLNYNTKSARCLSCFQSKPLNIKIDKKLELWYELLDQCLNPVIEYVNTIKDSRTVIHMIIAFPFYQSKIYSICLSKTINNISLQNLPDYRIDYNSGTYGMTNFNTIYDDDDQLKQNIPIKNCLIKLHLWRSTDNQHISSIITKQLNDDLNQKNVRYESIDHNDDYNMDEIHNFFVFNGLLYDTIFDIEPIFNLKMENLQKLIVVALFKDNTGPIHDLKCFGINSLINEALYILKSALICVVKNNNMRNVFVYRTVHRTRRSILKQT